MIYKLIRAFMILIAGFKLIDIELQIGVCDKPQASMSREHCSC